MSGFQKQWDGPKLTFSMMAGIGPLRAPITGWILPTDTDITINCDLPEFLEKLLPLSVQSNLQSSIRGLLKYPWASFLHGHDWASLQPQQPMRGSTSIAFH